MLDVLTDPRQLVPLFLSVNTVVVMWLAGSKRSLGWVLGLAGQAGWFALIVLFNTWGLLPLSIALTFVYGRNLWRWRRDLPRCSACGSRRDVAEHGWSTRTDYGTGVEWDSAMLCDVCAAGLPG